MNPKFGRRSWVKLWVNEWLDGTTRYQMTDAQRAFWIDLLAMAGRSRYGGVVCSGKDGERWIGYPLNKFQGLTSEPIDVLATFELFARTEKITMEVSGEPKLYTLFITKWEQYQSEYERVKKYRDTKKIHAKSQPQYGKGNTTEVEVDVEGEVEGDRPRTQIPRAPSHNQIMKAVRLQEEAERRADLNVGAGPELPPGARYIRRAKA